MNHIRLFDRAKGKPAAEDIPLTISGNLSNARAGVAYECRIPFDGEIGNVVVKSWSGDMPAATAVSIDNVTDEMVVTYPAYQVEDISSPVPIANANFDSTGGWSLGAGFQISGGVLFYLGSGEALAVSDTIVPCPVGRSVTASCSVFQGASKKGNCGGAIQIVWYDAARKVISFAEGNMVTSSDVPPFDSAVTSVAPAGTAYIGLAIHCFRRHENKEMHVDNVTWNHYATVGGNQDDTFCLTAVIRDEAGREAVFSDCMTVAIFPTFVSGNRAYKSDADTFTFLSNIPHTPGPRSPGTDPLTAGVSGDGEVLWYNESGGSDVDHIAMFDSDTATYSLVSRDGPTLAAGAGKFLRPWVNKTWILALYFDGVTYAWKWNGTSYVYDATATIDTTGAINARGFVWSPDGTKFAIVDSNGSLKIFSFDSSTGAQALLQSISAGTDNSVDWVGNYIVVGADAGQIKVYNATTYALVASVGSTYGTRAYLSLDQSHVYANGGSSLAVYDLNIGAGTLTPVNTYALSFNPSSFVINTARTYALATSLSGQKYYRLSGSDLVELGSILPGGSNDNYAIGV